MSEWGCPWASILAWDLDPGGPDRAWAIRSTDSRQVTPVSTRPGARVSTPAWARVPGVPGSWGQVRAWATPSIDSRPAIPVSTSLQGVPASLRGCPSLRAPAPSNPRVWPCQAQARGRLLMAPRVVTGPR